MNKFKHTFLKTIFFVLLSFSFAFLDIFVMQRNLAATDGFNQNNIISDQVFDDYNSMNENGIQNFLNSFPNSCLKSYSSEYPNDYFNYSGSTSAAAIIKQTSNTWHINPQIILATLEKEESLVSGSLGCESWRYNSAIGMGCPDGGTCPDPKYAGFSKQIMKGMWQLKFNEERSEGNTTWDDDNSLTYVGFMTEGNRARTYGGQETYYDGYSTIDGQSVHMDNGATAALYTYTPHFSGNESFSRIFNNWFSGSINNAIRLTQSLSITPNGSENENQNYTATFTLHNNSAVAINLGWILVSVRDAQGFNLDFPIENVSIGPNSDYTYKESRSFEWTDNMYAFINGNYNQNIGWSTDIPYAENQQLKSADFLVGSNVVIDHDGLIITKINSNTLEADVTLKNRTASPVNIGWFLVSARDPSGTNIDFPIENVTVPANGTYKYSKQIHIDPTDLGVYKFFTNLNGLNDRGWTTKYPMRNDIWTMEAQNEQIGPNVLQSSNLTANFNSDNYKTTANIVLSNVSSIGERTGWVVISTRRYNDDTNYDFPLQNVVVNSDSSIPLQFDQYLLRGGTYAIGITFNRTSGWDSTYAPAVNSAITRQTTVTTDYPIQQTEKTNIVSYGAQRTVYITLKNKSDTTLDAGWLVPSVRDKDNNNLDFPVVRVVLKPGETKTFSSAKILSAGAYKVSLTAYHPTYGWGPTFKCYDTGDIFNLQ